MGLFDKITIKVSLISLVKAIKWIRRKMNERGNKNNGGNNIWHQV